MCVYNVHVQCLVNDVVYEKSLFVPNAVCLEKFCQRQ